MAIRYFKILLVFVVGLQGWLYVAGNLANWSSGLAAVGYVLGMEGNTAYPTRIVPAVTDPALVTAAFLLIVAGEFLVGALSLKGAWDLWRARRSDAGGFNAAKTYAVLGPAMAMLVWFGGFVVIGGALFQMWQSEIGAASFEGAFIYGATSGLVLLFVGMRDAAP